MNFKLFFGMEKRIELLVNVRGLNAYAKQIKLILIN